jgi:hypothetical protein
LADLVKVTKGGNNPGTWMHEDVALEFARWLSPLFAIWCNDRIKELLRISSLVHNDTSRNILPGVHSPKAKMIGEHSIWTICLDDMLYYRLKDILNAINIYEHKRKETSKNWFKSYIYWINDQTGTVLHRYIKEPGVLFLISKTRTTKDNPSAQQFLTSFTRQAEKCRMQKTLSEDTWPETIEDTSRKEIDLNKFLDLTITIQDNDTRNFFFSVYKRLKG